METNHCNERHIIVDDVWTEREREREREREKKKIIRQVAMKDERRKKEKRNYSSSLVSWAGYWGSGTITSNRAGSTFFSTPSVSSRDMFWSIITAFSPCAPAFLRWLRFER